MQLESSITLFDDNKVENRFAELQVTADGITAEVGRKVGNNEVISRINQSAEAIQIQANKVNIEGATIFSSGRLSQNSLNNAYDAKGSAISTVDALKSDLSSSSGTTIINGGHIVTGTLSAGAVNANSGTFNTANIPNLNASKITAGTLSADRIGVGTLSVGKIDATSGTFNTANIPNLNASKINAGTLDAARIGTGTLAIGKLDSNAQTTISNAAKTATNFITNIDSSGIWVTPSGLKPTNTSTGAGATGTRINGNGMQIYKGGIEVASYSDTTIELGKNSDTSAIKFCKNYASLGGSYSTSSGTNIYTVKFSNDFPLTSSNQLSEFRISAGTNANNESGILFYANNDGSKSGMHIFANDAYIDFYYRKVTIGDYLVQVEVDGEADRIRMGTHTIPRDTSTSTSTGFYLGLKDYRWRQLYCWSAPNTGSDGKRKDVLGDIDFAKELIMGLEPVEFQWKDSDHIRSHMGFIAQDAAKVGKALGKNLSFYEANYIDESKGDYHGEEVDDKELSWGMMYEELIAPLVKVVQQQQKEIDQLKIELKHIEAEVSE